MKPAFSIINNGKELAAQYAPILEELTVTDSTTEQADAVKIRVSDIGNLIELPKKGELLNVSLGEDGNLTNMGIYIIDGVELEGPPDIIEITGSACPFSDAGAFTAMQTRRSRSWDGITIGDLVSGIANESGLTAAVSAEYATEEIDHLDQTSESNMNLLTRLARLYGAVFKPASGKLVFTRGGTGNAIDGTPIGTLAIMRGPGMRHQAIFSKRANFTAAKAACHDLDTGETGDFTAGLTADEAKAYREGKLEATPTQAKSRAWSKLRELKRGAQIVSLDLPGFYPVTAEQKVSLTGWRDEMNGVWIAKKIAVTITKARGLRTKIDCETPGNGDPADGEEDRGSLFGVDEDADSGAALPEESTGEQELNDMNSTGTGGGTGTDLPVPGALPEA